MVRLSVCTWCSVLIQRSVCIMSRDQCWNIAMISTESKMDNNWLWDGDLSMKSLKSLWQNCLQWGISSLKTNWFSPFKLLSVSYNLFFCFKVVKGGVSLPRLANYCLVNWIWRSVFATEFCSWLCLQFPQWLHVNKNMCLTVWHQRNIFGNVLTRYPLVLFQTNLNKCLMTQLTSEGWLIMLFSTLLKGTKLSCLLVDRWCRQ